MISSDLNDVELRARIFCESEDMHGNQSFSSRGRGSAREQSQPESYQRHPYQQHLYQQHHYQQHPYQQHQYQQHQYQQQQYQQQQYQQQQYQQHPYHQFPHVSSSAQYYHGQQPYNPCMNSGAPVRLPANTPINASMQGYYPSVSYEYPSINVQSRFPSEMLPSYWSLVNLITNPNFEAKEWSKSGETIEIKTEPWELQETGGDGWKLEKTPLGSKQSSCPKEADPYSHCVAGSFGWCKRAQLIDLDEKGFAPWIMDQEKPHIQVLEWFIARSDCDSEYFMKVTLLDEHREPIDCFDSGIRSAGSSEWQKVEHNFSSYPAGVRYIKFEDGSKDKQFWSGHYGAKMCQPTVKIHQNEGNIHHYPGAHYPKVQYPGPQSSETKYPEAKKYEYEHSMTLCDQPVNLIKNPSFTPSKWTGTVCNQAIFEPWTILKNGNCYCLEMKPIGTSGCTYPAELSKFDVWCVATSSSLSIRKQIVDLEREGFSADVMDNERPRIKIYEWFTSRTDCEGKYFLKVSLLDKKRQNIIGYSFDTGMKRAPVGCWFKEEYIFEDIPPGVRFIEFQDGGQDCKCWAGYYGVKMVGAFVGVMRESKHVFQEMSPPIPAEQVPPAAKPSHRSLLENANLKPKMCWDGNEAKDIDFTSWEVIENGGDGIQLEKIPCGTDAGPYPQEAGPISHCISTSFEWFKRVQTIDLMKHGIVPHVFNNPDLMIYACEWFASRIDNEGQYYLNVTLLDEKKQEIAGCKFESGVNKALPDEWEKVEFTFYPVPDEARYVRFEDGGKDTKIWAGRYGVKMAGAAIYVGKKHEKDTTECILM